MKHKSMSPREQQILRCFAYLPEKILSFHETENIVECILHFLCDEQCLNLSKAAYFIDNSDFDCLRGVAGFDKLEKYHESIIWEDPKEFREHMRNCRFNQKVRNTTQSSPYLANRNNNSKRKETVKDSIIETAIIEIGKKLSMTNPLFYTWNAKFNNKAIFIFEPIDHDYEELDQDILKAICLLGFCPIF